MVDHPVRRKIIMLLMVARSAGLVTIILTLILSFVDAGGGQERFVRLLWIAGGVLALAMVSRNRVVEHMLNRLIRFALTRWTDLDTKDYVSLLKLSGPYKVTELMVREGEWLAGKRIKDCRLTEEGVMILGIYRSDGSYVGVPRKNTNLHSGDTLIMYGRSDVLLDLRKRRNDIAGEKAHQKAVDNQKAQDAVQEKQDKRHEEKKRNRCNKGISGIVTISRFCLPPGSA